MYMHITQQTISFIFQNLTRWSHLARFSTNVNKKRALPTNQPTGLSEAVDTFFKIKQVCWQKFFTTIFIFVASIGKEKSEKNCVGCRRMCCRKTTKLCSLSLPLFELQPLYDWGEKIIHSNCAFHQLAAMLVSLCIINNFKFSFLVIVILSLY